MISRRPVTQQRRRYVACRPILTGIGIALGLGLVSASKADASTYRVYTASAASSMVLNANDGFCSLAEAVRHASGSPIYNCTDFAPGSSEQRIELLASPNLPLSTNHFKITSALTLNRQGVRIRIFGSGGFIDSTSTTSAFIILFKSIGFFERVTLTNTAGSAGGRLIENYGNLSLYGVTIANGDVSGAQHPTGRGGGIFNGNTQGMPGVISFAENSVITGNKAKRGGGVYNDAGNINELAVTISNNTATMAGGGIYNISSNPPTTVWTNGRIVTPAANIRGNRARAGGGVFNRGLVELLSGSSVTGNSTTSTGSSGESCTGSASCDGLGGGVLSVHVPNASDTRFQLQESDFSNNTASARGGAVYSVGVLELGRNTMNGNRAPDGAAIYVTAPTDGTQQYCNFYGDNAGAATINSNIANAGGYSIVAGGPGGVLDFRACTFGGLATPGQPTYLTATGNSNPYCRSAAVHSGSRCPQP
jgi:predicted outer membrane repeat protein